MNMNDRQQEAVKMAAKLTDSFTAYRKRVLSNELFELRKKRDEYKSNHQDDKAHKVQKDIYAVEDSLYQLGWYDEQNELAKRKEKNNEQ